MSLSTQVLPHQQQQQQQQEILPPLLTQKSLLTTLPYTIHDFSSFK